MHQLTGLSSRVLESKTTAEEASEGLLEYIKRWVPRPKQARIAGNSVHFDRSFLGKEPYRKVYDHLSHRIFDVSVFADAVQRWSAEPVKEGVPKKRYVHAAKEDILESLAEARYYREVLFRRACVADVLKWLEKPAMVLATLSGLTALLWTCLVMLHVPDDVERDVV
jgi:oligoribonuclease